MRPTTIGWWGIGMSALEKLWLQWEDGSLDEAGVAELNDLLQDPDNRAELYDHLQTADVITEVFTEERANAATGQTRRKKQRHARRTGPRSGRTGGSSYKRSAGSRP